MGFTPLEIAAINENTKGFDLLAPHYEENSKKKIAQLVIWGLTDSVPSAAFKLLFEEVPLAEVGVFVVENTLLKQIHFQTIHFYKVPSDHKSHKLNVGWMDGIYLRPLIIWSQVNSCTIVEFNLLSILAVKDKTSHVAFLLEQG